MITYSDVATATANDIKAVIDQLTVVEKNIRDGDIAALPAMLERWSSWGQMLLIRLEARTDEYRNAQEEASLFPSTHQQGGAK